MKVDFTSFHLPHYLPLLKELRPIEIGFAALLVILAIRSLYAPRSPYVARLGGLTWRRSQFCRGWLITGDTGSSLPVLPPMDGRDGRNPPAMGTGFLSGRLKACPTCVPLGLSAG